MCQGVCDAPVSDQQQPEEQGSLGPAFADRLNYLFDRRRSPSGRAFTNKEVSVASGGKLSQQYISQLRRGLVEMPRLDKLHALARVFGVPDTFFFATNDAPIIQADGPGMNDLTEDDLLRVAMKDPTMREIILESREYTADEWAILLDMMRYARAAITRARVQEQPRRGQGIIESARRVEPQGDT